MTLVQKVAKNTILLFVSQIITYLFGFFTTIYAAQYLGTQGFGILSLALAINGIFAVFTDLGLSTLLTREVARNKSLTNKYLSNIISIKVLLIFLTLILLFFTVTTIGYSKETSLVIYLMYIAYIFLAFSGIFVAVFQAHQKMEYQSIGSILSAAIILSGLIYTITHQLDIIFIVNIYLIGYSVVLIFYIIVYLTKFNPNSFDLDTRFCKLTLIEALPLSLAMIFALIHYRIDSVFLSFFNGESAVGLYSAAYNIMTFLTFIPVIFTTSIYPLLSQFYLSSKDSLKKLYQISFKFLILLFIPITFGGVLLAPQIILLLYNEAYLPSITVLQILLFTIPALFLSYLLGTLLTSINKQSSLFKAVLISTIVNIILNLILLPKYSYVGAAIATVISESLLCIIYFHFISRFVIKVKFSRLLIKPIIATAIMCLFIFYVKLNLILVIIIAIIIYFSILFALKTFSKEEIAILKDIFKIKRQN